MNCPFKHEVYITTKSDLARWVSDQWRPSDPELYSLGAEAMIAAITDYLWLDLHNNQGWNTQKPLPSDIDVFKIAYHLDCGGY